MHKRRGADSQIAESDILDPQIQRPPAYKSVVGNVYPFWAFAKFSM